jgi:hypothetical protein
MEGNATNNNNLVVGSDGAIYCMVKPSVYDIENRTMEQGNFLAASPGHATGMGATRMQNLASNVSPSIRSVPFGAQTFLASSFNPGNARAFYPGMAPFPGLVDGPMMHTSFQHQMSLVPDVSPLSSIGAYSASRGHSSLHLSFGNNSNQHGTFPPGAALHANSASLVPTSVATHENLAARVRRGHDDAQDSSLDGPAKRMRLMPFQAGQAFQGITALQGSLQTLQGRQSLQDAPRRTATGHSFSLYIESDERNLSQYQCLARKQIEIFEATDEEAGTNAQGRNRPIQLGQVGIRCRHCSQSPPRQRKTGAVYYPNRVSFTLERQTMWRWSIVAYLLTISLPIDVSFHLLYQLDGVYQTAQKMAVGHLCKHCTAIPDEIRKKLLFVKDQKSSDGGGKRYWADGVRSLGVIETQKDGLSFVIQLAK